MKFSIKKYALALSTTALLASTLILTVPAEAQKRKHSDRSVNHISWIELVQKLERDGYRIREIEMKRNGWEVEVIRGGERYELRLDGRGNVMRQKRDY